MTIDPDAVSWTSQFDELKTLEAKDRAYLESHARRLEMESGRQVFAPGKKPDAFMLLIDGTIRVQQVSANGREIVLFRISGGESCIMTTACLLSNEDYLAEGITETPVTAVALAKQHFDSLIASSPEFRELVFARYATRMTRLMALMEDVAFERIDKRLSRKLLELAHGEHAVSITHHALAVELGTAREVISRQIKALTAKGLVSTTRGHIEIIDEDGLASLAAEA